MYMFKYVVKRLGLMLFTFIIIFTMCFVLIKLLPIPTNVLPGQDPEIVMKTLEGRGWITNIREGENGVYEYDRVPIMLQYGNYIKRVLIKGDFTYWRTDRTCARYLGCAEKEQVARSDDQCYHHTAHFSPFYRIGSSYPVRVLLQARLVPADNVNK